MNLVANFCVCWPVPVRRSRTIRAERNLQLQVISSGYMKHAILHISNYKTSGGLQFRFSPSSTGSFSREAYTRAHVVGRRHSLPAPNRRALVLPSHLAQYVLATPGRLAPPPP